MVFWDPPRLCAGDESVASPRVKRDRALEQRRDEPVLPIVRHSGRAHFSVMSIVVTLGAVVGAVVEVVHAAELHAARHPGAVHEPPPVL